MDCFQLPNPAKTLMFIRNQAVLCLLLMCLTGCGAVASQMKRHFFSSEAESLLFTVFAQL